nr:MAG: DUF87 domain-containing protein [Candidatus Methanoperedens sp.]
MTQPPEIKRFKVDASGPEVIYSNNKDAFVLIKFVNSCSMQTIDKLDAFIDGYRALPDSGIFSALYNPLFPEADTIKEKAGPEASVSGFISYVLSPEINTIFMGTMVKPMLCDVKNPKQMERIVEHLWTDVKKQEQSILDLRNKKRRLYASFTSRLGGLQLSTSMKYNPENGIDDFEFIKRKQNIMLGPFFEQTTKIYKKNRYAYHELENNGKKNVRAYGFVNIGNLMGKIGRGAGNIIKGSPIEVLILKKETTDIVKSRTDFERMYRDARLSTVLKGLAGTRIPCSLNVIWEPVILKDFKERLHRDDKYTQMKSRDKEITESDHLQIGPKYSGISRTTASLLQKHEFDGQLWRSQYLWRGLQRGIFYANIILETAGEGTNLEEAIRQLETNLHTAIGIMRASFDTISAEIVDPEEAMKTLLLLTTNNFEKEDDGLVPDIVVNNEILSIFGHLPDFPLPADVDIVKFPDVQGRLTKRNLGQEKNNRIYFAQAIQDFKRVAPVALDAMYDPRVIGVISGKIGSGKTATMMQILKGTMNGDENGPFSDILVLDRHGEYHKLCSMTDVEIFVVPLWSPEVVFQVNILEPTEGRIIEDAIEDAAALFKQVIPQIGSIMQSVCRESLRDLYKKHGWTLHERYKRADTRSIPASQELLDHLKSGRFWEERKREGFKAESSQRYREAASSTIARLEKILAGHGGKILCPENGRSTAPPSIMFNKNIIIQFMYGNNNPLVDDAKNFISLMFIQHLWNYRLVHAIRFSDDRFDRKKHYGKNPQELNAIIRESMQTHMAESCIKTGVVAHKDDFIVQINGNTVTGKGTIEYKEESLPDLGEGFTISSISIESGKSSSFDPFDVSPQKIELLEITCALSIEQVLKQPRKIHTLVIEEAHNVAYERYDETDNTPSLVEQILSEIRKFGEGIWIVDQLPEMLEERVLKLANNLIVHKTDEDHAVAKMAAQLGILEEPPMYEFLRILSPGMALLKLNSSQATYPIEVCYPEMERSELSERELIESGNRLKEICIEEEKTSSRVILDAVPDVKQVFDSEDMKKRGFKHILSFGTGAEPGISNQKLAILSIMAYNECYAEPLSKDKLLEQYREIWKRDIDETHINEIMEMGLLIRYETMTENDNIRMLYVLTDRGKQFIASSVHLFEVPLYHLYKQNSYKENGSGKEKEKDPEETENIFSDLISPAVSKNNRELTLTNRPPFAFIVSGIQTVGVLSKQESIGMAVDMLRKKSIDEVIMINEKNPDLKDLRIPGFKVLSKKELVDMIEKGYETTSIPGIFPSEGKGDTRLPGGGVKYG